MYKINEIAPDVYRISIFASQFNIQFNHFLIVDDEPLLYHAGLQGMFPLLLEAVKTLINPEKIRWIGFSHYEVDECGGLNNWLQIAPNAQAVCSEVGAIVNMSDFAIRPSKALCHNEILQTGKYKYRFIRTPHLPHGWDAGVMFEEANQTLLCSDLFHQNGDVTYLTDIDILEGHKKSMLELEKSPLMDYVPYNHNTGRLLKELAGLNPRTLATMHGSSFYGDCSKALLDLDGVMKELWGDKKGQLY
ncbi:MAG: MBL fold metallo-hydrolase [Bacteroidota bacterium]|nr:MBL fold metallo-hydrolase [Bacteroidota bacterium]